MVGGNVVRFVRAKVVTPRGVLDDAAVTVVGTAIASVDQDGGRGGQSEKSAKGQQEAAAPAAATVIDVGGCYLVPGFIDVHLHGAAGHDFMDAPAAGVLEALTWLAKRGVTSCLPTTVTAGEETLRERVRVLAQAAVAAEAEPGCARVLGLHLEGPFLSPKRPGAMKPHEMREPDLREVQELAAIAEAAAGLGIRLVTLAPELPGALDLIRGMGRMGIRASVGHSDATFAQVTAAVEAGLCHATHTYNAMKELHHREPGTVGAVLMADAIMAELILDGLHVHPAAAKVLLKCKGENGVVLISDSVAAAGAGLKGRYRMLDGLEVVVDESSVRLPSGMLAGSLLSMDVAVRNAVRWLGLPVESAVALASTNAARAIGVEDRKGTIQPGKDADLVVLDRELNVRLTMVMGRVAWQACYSR